jgi:serine/threonine kinase 16
MCYFKSPFDSVYERGDSVALAVISANITFPESAPYNEVSYIKFKFILDLIAY